MFSTYVVPDGILEPIPMATVGVGSTIVCSHVSVVQLNWSKLA